MRLKLDLGDFLSDERRLSLLCVKTEECRTVGDVIIRICQVFSVGPKDGNSVSYAEVALFDDGFFIHPNQCSSILEGGGVLKLQWLRSQEAVKKKKKRDSIDDIELVEVQRIKVEVGNNDEWENKKGKIKRQCQEIVSSQLKESEQESLKKKKKKKTQNSDSESSKNYKKPLDVCEIDEKVQLNSETECSKNSKKRKIINTNDINHFNDNKEVVEINHEKKEVKASKRKKHHSQEHVEKENAIVVNNIDNSIEEIIIVDSSKSKKFKLKKICDTQNVKSRKNTVPVPEPDKNVVDSTSSDNISLKDSDVGNVKCHNKYKGSNQNMDKQRDRSFEVAEVNETSESVTQICTENNAKLKNIYINQEKTEEQETIKKDKIDSENNKYDDNDNITKKGKRRRKRSRKNTKLTCVEEANSGAQFFEKPANFLVASTKISSGTTKNTIETQMYNFSYARPRNKKPMSENGIPHNKHIIFNGDDDVTIEKSIQKIDSVDENITKKTLKGKLSSSLWDVSDITILNNSHCNTNNPGTSTPIIPPQEITVVENSCNEISSTSMHKCTYPSRTHKINTTEENENIFGALLEMSKSEKPVISTYVGRKVKEKPNNCTGTVSSAMEQHQRRSPPKGVPTHLPQNEEVSHIFHNLLAAQNFPQAFICPRTPPISKLTCVNTNKETGFTSIGMTSSIENGITAQPKAFTNLNDDYGKCIEVKIEEKEDLRNDYTQENSESEKEIEEMRKFTKPTVEANIAEAKAAMYRRKRARPKAISSIGTLLNRIKAGELNINVKEESESNSSEEQSIKVEDILGENITSTLDTNESEIFNYINEANMIIDNLQTVKDENLNSEEKNNLKCIDQEVDLISENSRQSECKYLEKHEIKAVNVNNNQKNKTEENIESVLEIKEEEEEEEEEEEVNVVEPDLEISEIKESDCVIVNASSDKLATVSPNKREQLLSGGAQSSKLTQSSSLTRSPIKTVITVKDEDNIITSPIKETKSYSELGEAFFDQFPLMKVLPKVKEFVAVKLLSLDENCIPVYSSYQQAQVFKVQGTSITLRYIDKLEKLPSKDGQVQVVDLTMEGNGITETVDWRDVYEPRLIFP